MIADSLSPEERRCWSFAGTVALAAHVGAAGMVLGWTRPAAPVPPEPVVLVELPPQAAPVAAPASLQSTRQPLPDRVRPQASPPAIETPPVHTPLPSNPVILSPPPRQEAVQQADPTPADPSPAPVAVALSAPRTGMSATQGNDPRAKKQEADYFALVSAHLNRRKIYPAEARQARQQGIVTVRFTVDRNGGVSGVSIKRGSGHELLDRATLELLQRVAPLPRMPASMPHDSVTLSLPIDYSLRTS